MSTKNDGRQLIDQHKMNHTDQETVGRSTKKKQRKRWTSIIDFLYTVSDSLFNRIRLTDVKSSSGAVFDIKPSSEGIRSILIRGTRSQCREALRLITEMTGEQAAIQIDAKTYWLQWVEEAFPHYEAKTYFLPPVYVARVPMTKLTVAGQDVFVLHNQKQVADYAGTFPSASAQESDVGFDEALQRVLFTLKTLSMKQRETFICLSQFSFGSYLGEHRFAKATANLPLPSNLPKTLPWSWRQGDFDVLLIHKKYGFVICEVKAVSYNTVASQEEQEKQNIRVTKKLKEAAEHLKKAEAMLSHLVSDIADDIRITTTIACPNITSLQMQQIISQNQQLEQDLCKCFSVEDSSYISRMFLCSDRLCLPQRERDKETSQRIRYQEREINQWWQERVVGPECDSQLSSEPDLYKTLIARFCGPASTLTVPSINAPRVSIKTWDQAVAHVGYCYTAHITLFPEQIDLLVNGPPKVFIAGPPGTGKSVILLLKAVDWLLQGNDVCVLSTWDRSLAASFMLFYLLQDILCKQNTESSANGKVHIKKKNFKGKKDVENTLEELEEIAEHRPLCIIADEVGPDLELENYVFSDFCATLVDRLDKIKESVGVYLWAASYNHTPAPHEGWKLETFTRPLRSPPPVIREINMAAEIKRGSVREYSERCVADHADGPPVKWVYHTEQTHRSPRVEDCEVCGKKVARFLTHDLQLGVIATLSKPSPFNTEIFSSSSRAQPVLQYRDVLLLSWVELREDSGILKALSKPKIPVRVMSDSEEDLSNVATASSNVVWVARHQLVRGLERKVIVCLDNYDDSGGKYASTRLYAMSRCTSQLVVVCPPPNDDQDSEED